MARFLVVVLLACACAGRPPPSGNGDGRDSAQPPGDAPGTDPSPAPTGALPQPADSTLLDANVARILAISPDERRLLVSRQPVPQCGCCTSAGAVEVSLLTVGAGTVPLGFTAHKAWFSPDGRFVQSTQNTCRGTADQAWVARADGSGLRPSPASGYTFAGSWLYSSDDQGVHRQRDLDEVPQLVLPSGGNGRFVWAPSPDGDAIAYCKVDASGVPVDCAIQAPVGAAPVPFAAPQVDGFRWSTGGSSLFSPPCTTYDRTSGFVWSCDSSTLAPALPEALPRIPGNPFVDEKLLAFVTRDPDGFVVHVRTVATGKEVVLPSLPWLPGIKATADHSTIVASTRDFVPSLDEVQTIAAAPAHGGQWSVLSDDAKDAFVAPFGSIVVMNSRSRGVIASVADAPAHPIAPPDLKLYTPPIPFFEPAGGLDKVMFFAADAANIFHMAIGNADGTGEWVRLPPDTMCDWWAGHSAACAGPADGFFIVPGGGNTPKLIVRNPRQIEVSATKIFYVDAAGLHVTANR